MVSRMASSAEVTDTSIRTWDYCRVLLSDHTCLTSTFPPPPASTIPPNIVLSARDSTNRVVDGAYATFILPGQRSESQVMHLFVERLTIVLPTARELILNNDGLYIQANPDLPS